MICFRTCHPTSLHMKRRIGQSLRHQGGQPEGFVKEIPEKEEGDLIVSKSLEIPLSGTIR